MVSEAIILSGGKGKRLRSITMDEIPKGLARVKDKTILEWEIEWLAREGVNHVILALGHLANIIVEKLGNKINTKYNSVDISYSVEKEKLGSGGAVKQAASFVNGDKFLIINGDILTNSSLDSMNDLHVETNALATMFLIKMRSPYGVVTYNDKLITQFLEKPLLDVYIHGGVDIIEKSMVHRFPDKGQMEETIFLDLVKENRFAAYRAGDHVFWNSIDSEKDFDNANLSWPGLEKR